MSLRLTVLQEEHSREIERINFESESQIRALKAQFKTQELQSAEELHSLRQEKVALSASVEFLKNNAEMQSIETQTDSGFVREVESLRKHVGILEASNEELVVRDEDKNKRLVAAAQEIKAFEDWVASLSLEKNNLSMELSVIRDAVLEEKNSKNVIAEEKRCLQEELALLKADLDSKSQSICRLENETLELETDLRKEKASLSETIERATTLQSDLEECGREMALNCRQDSDLRDSMELVKYELKAAIDDNERIRSEYEEREKLLRETIANEVEELSRDNLKLKDENQTLYLDVSKRQESINEIMERCKKLEAEVTALKVFEGFLYGQNDAESRELSLKNHIAQEQQGKSTLSELQTTTEKLDTASRDNAELSQRIKTLESRIAQMEMDKSNLNTIIAKSADLRKETERDRQDILAHLKSQETVFDAKVMVFASK